MIPLHPTPDPSAHVCPDCDTLLDTCGWVIPGKRTLTKLVCLRCQREFFGDLPSGHGLVYPLLLDKQTGSIVTQNSPDWFVRELRESYQNQSERPVAMEVESFRPIERPLLLNCLDTYYGHCLLKLLNAQYHLDHHQEYDLIVLVPSMLRWMVPPGVAEIWSVDLSLDEQKGWYPRLAEAIHTRLDSFDQAWLSRAVPHPHPGDFDIERFSQVEPFDIQVWSEKAAAPHVTWIWREDRRWVGREVKESWLGKLDEGLSRLRHWPSDTVELWLQRNSFVRTAERLRQSVPCLQANVVGLGTATTFPEWIEDLRVDSPNRAVEKRWCERYAQSHIVIGIHGSNMLLPTAHAGASIILMPPRRWSNMTQDVLIDEDDSRLMTCRCQYLPTDTSCETVADLSASLLEYLPQAQALFSKPFTDHRALFLEPRIAYNRYWKVTD